MHEMGLARQLVAASIEAANRQQVRRIAAVSVEVSPLAAVDIEELQECFALAALGTAAEAASLQVERLPLAAVCRKCGERVTLDATAGALGSCSKCGSESLEIPPMADWRVVSVELL
jgi:hydrogenase nickel incorporation protein HypA/HybF